MVHFFFGKIKVEETNILEIVPLVFMKSQFLPSGKENDNFALEFFWSNHAVSERDEIETKCKL